MKKTLLKLAEECFEDARITDELCSASIKKYRSSIKRFSVFIRAKKVADLDNYDFDLFIVSMKKKNAGNARIANVIASVKWVITKLQQKGVEDHGISPLNAL